MQRFKHAAMSLNNLQTICKALYSCCYHKTNGGQKKAQATHRRSRATETVTNLSFIFETWRADFRSSYRKTQEQRHRPWNPGDVYFLSQEGVKNTRTERGIVNWKLLTETLQITVLDYCNVIVLNSMFCLNCICVLIL